MDTLHNKHIFKTSAKFSLAGRFFLKLLKSAVKHLIYLHLFGKIMKHFNFRRKTDLCG